MHFRFVYLTVHKSHPNINVNFKKEFYKYDFKQPTLPPPNQEAKNVLLTQHLFKNNRFLKKNKKTKNENKQKPGKRPSLPSKVCF